MAKRRFYQPVSIVFPVILWDKIKETAEKSGLSAASLVRLATIRYLASEEKRENEKQ
jgi:hypothetical protein